MLEKLIVFVEEDSAEAALNLLLSKLLGDVDFQIIRFQGKKDLLQQAPTRLRGYASWLLKDWRILVLVDCDDEDCFVLKSEIENMAADAGLLTKTATGGSASFCVVNRIACEELEAWFFGDWAAVKAAFPRVPATVPCKAGFRDPDAIVGGTWEAMERLLQRAGYFKGGLRKVDFARCVTSRSFQAFSGAISAALS